MDCVRGALFREARMSFFGKCGGGGRRSTPRVVAPLIAMLTTLSRSDPAVVLDVSTTGARVRGGNLPKAGEELLFTVDKVRAFSTVVWSEHGECGIEFDGPLPAADINQLRFNIAKSAGLRPEVRAAMDDWMAGLAR